MATLKERIVVLLKETPGLTDRQITDNLLGRDKPQQSVNIACRGLEAIGVLMRQQKSDGKKGNFLTGQNPIPLFSESKSTRISKEGLSEDEIKKVLDEYLKSQGWETRIAWGKSQGIDIEAKRNSERWVIEVKGPGSLQPMRVNYFIGILGELLQRMDDQNAKYSIALPDMPQFRGLWERLPRLAKQRTKITAIFVDHSGNIVEEL